MKLCGGLVGVRILLFSPLVCCSDIFLYFTLLNTLMTFNGTTLHILSAQFFPIFFYLQSWHVCRSTAQQPIFIHWIFAAFQFFFFILATAPTQLFWITCQGIMLQMGMLWLQRCKKLFHDSVILPQWIESFCIQSVAEFPFFMGFDMVFYSLVWR